MKPLFLIEKLRQEKQISIRPHGNSMVPKIYSKNKVTIKLINDNDDIHIDEIVFCKVQGRYYIHLVSAIKDNQWQISNNHGHVNGWTTRDKIYGKVTKIEK